MYAMPSISTGQRLSVSRHVGDAPAGAALGEPNIDAAQQGVDPIAYAPVPFGQSRGDPQIEEIDVAALSDAVHVMQTLFGTVDGATTQLDPQTELDAYLANPNRSKLSFATWLSLRDFAKVTPLAINTPLLPSPATQAGREAIVTKQSNHLGALMRLSPKLPRQASDTSFLWCIRMLSRADVARLAILVREAAEHGSQAHWTIDRVISASPDLAPVTRFSPSMHDDQWLERDLKTVTCLIERSADGPGVDVHEVLPDRPDEVMFTPGTRFLIRNLLGDPAHDARLTVELEAVPQDDARFGGCPETAVVANWHDESVPLADRYRTFGGALKELQELVCLAACNPSWAADRVQQRGEDGWRAGNRLAELLESKSTGEHAMALAGQYCRLLSLLVQEGELTADAALQLVIPEKKWQPMRCLANVLAGRWSGAPARELAALFARCLSASSNSLESWRERLSLKQNNVHKVLKLDGSADFFTQINESHSLGNGNARATRMLLDLKLIDRRLPLHKLARELNPDESLSSDRGAASSPEELRQHVVRMIPNWIEREKAWVKSELDRFAALQDWEESRRMSELRDKELTLAARHMRVDAMQDTFVGVLFANAGLPSQRAAALALGALKKIGSQEVLAYGQAKLAERNAHGDAARAAASSAGTMRSDDRVLPEEHAKLAAKMRRESDQARHEIDAEKRANRDMMIAERLRQGDTRPEPERAALVPLSRAMASLPNPPTHEPGGREDEQLSAIARAPKPPTHKPRSERQAVALQVGRNG